MKRVLASLSFAGIGLVVLASYFAFSKQTVSFAPTWRVGQSWKVQAFSRQGTATKSYSHTMWKFKVESRRQVNDETVFTIKVSAENVRGTPVYVLKLSQPELRPIGLSTYLSGEVIDERPLSGAALAKGGALLPLDSSELPFFEISWWDRNKDLTLKQRSIFGSGRNGFNQDATFTQRVVADRLIRRLDLLLVANQADQIKNFQSWEQGKPWWVGAKRWHKGVLETEAILVDY